MEIVIKKGSQVKGSRFGTQYYVPNIFTLLQGFTVNIFIACVKKVKGVNKLESTEDHEMGTTPHPTV
jgi:hypothetical protein